MIRVFAPLLSALVLAGCASQPPVPTVDRSTSAVRPAAPAAVGGPGYYTVKRGDTLYRIALENGQDYRDVAAWNNITNPATIREGQVLRVAPPGATQAAATGGVVAQPVITAPAVEARPLDAPKSAAPSAPATPAAVGGEAAKREPRGGKEPYSDEAYARLNRAGETSPKPAPVAVDPKPEPKSEAQPKPEAQPEARPEPAASGSDDVTWNWPSAGKVVAPYSEAGNKGLDFGGRAGDPVLAAGDGKVVYAGAGLRGYGELVIVKHNATFLSAYAHNRRILVKEGQQVTRGQKIAEMGSTDSDAVKLHFEIRKQGKPIDPLLHLPKR
jgi:lipoprotein NlpD